MVSGYPELLRSPNFFGLSKEYLLKRGRFKYHSSTDSFLDHQQYFDLQFQSGLNRICISEITSVALFSLLIGTEDRRRLPAGRQGRPKRPNINLLPIIFLSFLPTGKLADNQKIKYPDQIIYLTAQFHFNFACCCYPYIVST
jgi:hypothetical protein